VRSQQPGGGIAPMPLQNSEAVLWQNSEAPPSAGDIPLPIPDDNIMPEGPETLPGELGIEEDTQQVLVPGEAIEPQDQ
jgi:hypothetical protein